MVDIFGEDIVADFIAVLFSLYEIDPLECPQCGSAMKIVGFIERDNDGFIRSLLK